MPVFFGHTEAVQTCNIENPNVVAFAGIGHPQKFYHTLSQQGFNIAEAIDFPDHHFYTREELEKILEKAKALKAEVYTTSKDYVKIPHFLQKEIKVLEVAVVWDNPEELTEFIRKKISSAA